MYFDEFTDCLEGLLDCVDLLYGADVTLTMDNIQAVLKFGVLYKVSNMVACGLAWVKDELSMTNFFSFCRIGLFIKSVDCTEDKVLTGCKNFILNHSSSDLLEISKSWPEDKNVVSFLFDKDLLEVTLPTITSLINSEKKASAIMDMIEELDLQNPTIGVELTDLQEMTAKINEVCKTVPNLKRVISLMTTLGKRAIEKITVVEPTAKRIRFNSVTLLKNMKSKAWRSFDKDELLAMDFRHNSHHFFYAEIVLDWINFNRPRLEVTDELWKSIKQENLNYAYIANLWYSMSSHHPLGLFPFGYAREAEPKEQPYDYYKYMGPMGRYADTDAIKDKLRRASNQELPFSFRECLVKECHIQTIHKVVFKLMPGIPCYKLAAEPEDAVVRTLPGHYHHDKLKHFYATMEDQFGERVMLSFVTNTIGEVYKAVRASRNIELHFLFEF